LDICWRGVPGLRNLKGDGRGAFVSYVSIVLRTFESLYLQEMDDTFDSKLFGGWSTTYFDLFANKGPRELLEIRKHHFNAEFIGFVQYQLASAAPKDMYSNAEP
jgi:hypothetical protein